MLLLQFWNPSKLADGIYKTLWQMLNVSSIFPRQSLVIRLFRTCASLRLASLFLALPMSLAQSMCKKLSRVELFFLSWRVEAPALLMKLKLDLKNLVTIENLVLPSLDFSSIDLSFGFYCCSVNRLADCSPAISFGKNQNWEILLPLSAFPLCFYMRWELSIETLIKVEQRFICTQDTASKSVRNAIASLMSEISKVRLMIQIIK